MNNTGQQHTSFDGFGNPIQVTGTPDADIDAPEAWDITSGDPTVKIAILDTGIDCDSVEHAGMCVEQTSFVGDYSDYGYYPVDITLFLLLNTVAIRFGFASSCCRKGQVVHPITGVELQ